MCRGGRWKEGKMLTYNDTIKFAGQWETNGPIDPATVKQLIALMIQLLQLSITVLLIVIGVINALDAIGQDIAVTFWRGWDITVMKIRLWLWPMECMVRITI